MEDVLKDLSELGKVMGWSYKVDIQRPDYVDATTMGMSTKRYLVAQPLIVIEGEGVRIAGSNINQVVSEWTNQVMGR